MEKNLKKKWNFTKPVVVSLRILNFEVLIKESSDWKH